MQNRCYNKDASGYSRYGGRGIRVCPRWLEFENFISDMGPRPSPKHSVHRKDNDGPYSPKNCCWATTKEQSQNKDYTIYRRVRRGGLAELVQFALDPPRPHVRRALDFLANKAKPLNQTGRNGGGKNRGGG